MSTDQNVLPSKRMNRASTLFVAIVAILLSPIWLPALFGILLLWLLWGALLQVVVWLMWLPLGRDTLVVYSDSPYWKELFEQRLMPQVRSRVIVINCSQRKSWNRFSLSTLAFQYVGGSRDNCPMIVVFRPFRWAKIFRFWKAFQDDKHDKPQKLISLLEGVSQQLAIPEILLAR